MVDGFAEDIDFGTDRVPNNEFCGVAQPILSDTLPDNADNMIKLYNPIVPVGATPL